MIKNTIENDKSRPIPLPIIGKLTDEAQINDIISRFKWVSNISFLLCSSWGFEKLFEIQGNYLDEIGSSQIPCYKGLSKDTHIYFEKESLDIGNLQKRLIRKNQSLKRLRFLCGNEDHSLMFETLFSIDYNVNGGLGKFVSDLSFSYLQWKLIEEVERGQRSCKDLDHCILS